MLIHDTPSWIYFRAFYSFGVSIPRHLHPFVTTTDIFIALPPPDNPPEYTGRNRGSEFHNKFFQETDWNTRALCSRILCWKLTRGGTKGEDDFRRRSYRPFTYFTSDHDTFHLLNVSWTFGRYIKFEPRLKRNFENRDLLLGFLTSFNRRGGGKRGSSTIEKLARVNTRIYNWSV